MTDKSARQIIGKYASFSVGVPCKLGNIEQFHESEQLKWRCLISDIGGKPLGTFTIDDASCTVEWHPYQEASAV